MDSIIQCGINTTVTQLCIFFEKQHRIPTYLTIKKWNSITGMKVPLIWYLYIIETRCKKWYTGITTDVLARFNVHSSGKGAKYLKGKGPFKLIFQKIMGSKSIALQEEYRVKQLSKADKIIYTLQG
ncbi:GIY-YIG domain protein [Invertebrate iridovirus 25]|uniref:GIY-YIG domain protein n=1 Tax=Invertebrate iridovirus 25 TaxID=1301280 RepID=W8W2G4_9VIRU|nr:GIY-YIG domain protein [Invertebrate iridovirus 25]CCV02160.1 GIY-YIG domain protein [Invertebrate iridovirus 25]